jgi:3-hydroxyisobutyrate dehydrogenase-like beta-hydroxyacid dehydrogenase
MDGDVAFIGFGEAAQAFAEARNAAGSAPRAYDIKTDDGATRDAKRADYARSSVRGCDSAGEALAGASAVLALVTADQALPAAQCCAGLLDTDTLWLDMNSVAPGTKRAAAAMVEAAGGRYLDVAVMAPVHPARRAVPLLLSGPAAMAGAEMLTAIGFSNIRVVGDRIGMASAIKMIRSVMVKGLEALTTECVLAAEAAGVRDEVFASLDASWPGADWAAKADYNLDRMMVHGLRRAAEMEEAVKTLDALGTGSACTRATVERQCAVGELRIAPPDGLDAKLSVLTPFVTTPQDCAA